MQLNNLFCINKFNLDFWEINLQKGAFGKQNTH